MLNNIQAIIDDRTLPSGHYKTLLLTIASYDEKRLQISQTQLMKDAGIGSRNTVVKVIKYLNNNGWLKVTKERNECNHFDENVYELVIPNVK
jgi:hypothetical protein